ncbi:MAG: GxxExxY protein [Melioribacteraceae bacterium]|nr:GxxExxY protein [Melioribacteraceae bacterium]
MSEIFKNMTENEIAKIIVNSAFKVHTSLGPGLLESVYEKVLAYEIDKQGLVVERQVPMQVKYDDFTFDEGYRADLIIENKVIIELKSIETLAPVHYKQLLTYLRISDLRLGLLINFNEALIKNGIHRIVNGLKE